MHTLLATEYNKYCHVATLRAGTDHKRSRLPKMQKNTNPHPGLGPENTKENTEKIQKSGNNFRAISPFFLISFLYFWGQPKGGFYIFCRNFFVFSGLRGFCVVCTRPRWVANIVRENPHKIWHAEVGSQSTVDQPLANVLSTPGLTRGWEPSGSEVLLAPK